MNSLMNLEDHCDNCISSRHWFISLNGNTTILQYWTILMHFSTGDMRDSSIETQFLLRDPLLDRPNHPRRQRMHLVHLDLTRLGTMATPLDPWFFPYNSPGQTNRDFQPNHAYPAFGSVRRVACGSLPLILLGLFLVGCI